jgi:hypothetical protein
LLPQNAWQTHTTTVLEILVIGLVIEKKKLKEKEKAKWVENL